MTIAKLFIRRTRCRLPPLSRWLPAAALSLLFVTVPALAESVSSYAKVNDDGSLVVRGRTIELAGIYIPKTKESCIGETSDNCRTRAAAALDFRVQGFIYCDKLQKIGAVWRGTCFVDRTPFDKGTDLAAYLVESGWALALPDASFEYLALEKLARTQLKGLWGGSTVRVPAMIR